MHDHICGCKHDLEYCAHCDIVYCKKCGKEWKHDHYNYTYPYYTWKSTVPEYLCTYTSSVNESPKCSHGGVSG